MDPAIWSAFPEDILELVFAHLPLAEIFRLQCLSKKWKETVTEPGSAFRQACAANNPNSFAIVSVLPGDHECGVFHIRAFDTKFKRWHTFHIKTMDRIPFHQLTASDGGLVCYVSRVNLRDRMPLVIAVCNPLTRETKVLPTPNVLSWTQPEMVQLVMDRRKKCYEVIVAGGKDGGCFAEIYNSKTGAWSESTNSASDCVFGYCSRKDGLSLSRSLWWYFVPVVLDCREGQLLELDILIDYSRFERRGHLNIDLVKDHFFVLDSREEKIGTDFRTWYSVTEFRCQNCSPSWVKLTEHQFTPITWNYPEVIISPRLYACRGLLLLSVISLSRAEAVDDITQLYDLSTRTCRKIPNLPRRAEYETFHKFECESSKQHWAKPIMCELQWDAHP